MFVWSEILKIKKIPLWLCSRSHAQSTELASGWEKFERQKKQYLRKEISNSYSNKQNTNQLPNASTNVHLCLGHRSDMATHRWGRQAQRQTEWARRAPSPSAAQRKTGWWARLHNQPPRRDSDELSGNLAQEDGQEERNRRRQCTPLQWCLVFDLVKHFRGVPSYRNSHSS